MIAEIQTDFNVEAARLSRKIEPFISDYLPDDASFCYHDRVKYYRSLKDTLGITSVRTEFRMKDLINTDSGWNELTASRYGDSLRAMKEAGLTPPTIVLFTPADWMYAQAKTNPQQFVDLYGRFAGRVAELCQQTGVAPSRVQVMNEVNTQFQTKIGFETTIALIQKTAEIFRGDFPKTKIVTTVLTEPDKNWRVYTTKLLKSAGDNLDGIGFDYYPGTYEYPANIPFIGKKPYEAFAGKTPYPWIASEKKHGILKEKEVIVAEIGVPALNAESKFQRFGYDRIVQTLDHFFLDLERGGVPAHEVISAIGFFQGGRVEGVDTKAPGGIDFFPWTIVRKNSSGVFEPTNAGRRLKDLIRTRINPSLFV